MVHPVLFSTEHFYCVKEEFCYCLLFVVYCKDSSVPVCFFVDLESCIDECKYLEKLNYGGASK